MIDQITLEPELQDLFSTLVESFRNVQREERQAFDILPQAWQDKQLLISHPGLVNSPLYIYSGDINILHNYGLISLIDSQYPPYGRSFDITPFGYRYYEHMKSQMCQPTQRIEKSIKDYLASSTFQKNYSIAYKKWLEAKKKLWSSDNERHFTMVGHLCRETMQEFATSLVGKYRPPNVETDKAKTIARVRAVLNIQKEKLGKTEKSFLVKLLAYWG